MMDSTAAFLAVAYGETTAEFKDIKTLTVQVPGLHALSYSRCFTALLGEQYSLAIHLAGGKFALF